MASLASTLYSALTASIDHWHVIEFNLMKYTLCPYVAFTLHKLRISFPSSSSSSFSSSLFGCQAAESENNHYKLPFATCHRICGGGGGGEGHRLKCAFNFYA